ncbi:MAG: Fe-S cluster assembly protein NifU [Opitutae bacterium]|nr:Fe-S cluster assembly protein NifU [Opitutae bacterium]
MWNYTDKVMDHFLHPRNVGEVENPDGVGEVGNAACGDALKLTFKLDKDGRITDVKFKTFGCASAIASSSVLTELVKGMTLEEATKVTNQQIAEALGGLPDAKMHCSVMGMEALQKAISNYKGEESPFESDHEHEGRIVCKCFGVTEPYLRRKIKELNLRTIDDIVSALKAGGMCGACRYAPGGLQDILNETWGTGEPAPTTVAAEPVAEEGMSPFQRYRKIEKVIDETVRPVLKGDGGDIELVDIKDWTVYCGLRGACAGCMGASRTLQLIVERTLKDQVDERIRVVPV